MYSDVYHLKCCKTYLAIPPRCPADMLFWVMTVGLSLHYSDSIWQGILSHLKRLLPLKSQVLSLRRSHPQIAGDLRQPRVTFHLQGRKRALGLSDTPILQGVLVPSAGGSGGNNSLWAPSSVPASSLSCQTGYQTGIPATTQLHFRLACWQRERGVFSYLWMVSFFFFLDSPDSDAKFKTYAA